MKTYDYFLLRFVLCATCFDILFRPGFLFELFEIAVNGEAVIFYFKSSFLNIALIDFLEFLFTATGWSLIFLIES